MTGGRGTGCARDEGDGGSAWQATDDRQDRGRQEVGPMRGAMTCIALALAILVGANLGTAYGFAAFFAMVGLISMAGPGDDGRQ